MTTPENNTPPLRWTVWVGLLGNDKLWRWTRAGSRRYSQPARTLARKLARDHHIKADFCDGRAVAFGSGEWKPSGSTLIVNRNGNFYPLAELWPEATEAA